MGGVHTLIKKSPFPQHTMLVIGIGDDIAFAASTVLQLIKCAWSQNCIGTKKVYKTVSSKHPSIFEKLRCFFIYLHTFYVILIFLQSFNSN